MFWCVGTEIIPGERELIALKDGEVLQINMATLGPKLKDHGRTVLTVEVGDRERPIAVCSLLPEKAETQVVSLIFAGEENIRFNVVGKNSVHVTGTFQFNIESDSEGDSIDGEEMADLLEMARDDDDVSGDDDEDDENDVEFIPPRMIDEDPLSIRELVEDGDEDDDEEEPVQQKGAGAKGKKKGKKSADEMEEMELLTKASDKKKILGTKNSKAQKRARDDVDMVSPPAKKKKVSERIATPGPKKLSTGGKMNGVKAGPESKSPSTPKTKSPGNVEAKTPESISGGTPGSPKKKKKRRRSKGKGNKAVAQ